MPIRAAIKKDDFIYIGISHDSILKLMRESGMDIENIQKGWTDRKGKFLINPNELTKNSRGE